VVADGAATDVSAVAALAGNEIRRRWRSALLLAVLVGLVGAIVLSAAAGARRSASSLQRFVSYSRSSDLAYLPAFAYTPTAAQMRAVRAVRDVVAVSTLRFFAVRSPDLPQGGGLAAPVDASEGTLVNRSRVIRGRRANPDAPAEVNVDEPLAARLHLTVGSHIALQTYTPAQVQAQSGGPPPNPEGPNVTLTVVGLVRQPVDIGAAASQGTDVGEILNTPGFNRVYADRIGNFGVLLNIRTVHGPSDESSVTPALQRIFAKTGGISPQSGSIFNAQGAQDAINVLTLALWILAGVAALAGAVTLAIVLSRDLAASADDQSTLRALGLTRSERVLARVPRVLMIVAVGGLLAVAGAIALSPMFPVGIARLADPDVGVHVDWLVVLVGAVATSVIVFAIAFVALLRGSSSAAFRDMDQKRYRASAIADATSRMSAPPTMTSGLRLALEPGRGRTAVPVRSAHLGAFLGVFAVSTVVVLTANLGQLIASPARFGWNWDFKTTDVNFDGSAQACGRNTFGLTSLSSVGAVAAVCNNTVQIGGQPSTGWSITAIRGAISPTIITGRAPENSNEVALGDKTMHELRTHIGGDVPAQGLRGSVTYRVVGRAVFADFGGGTPLASGALFTPAGLLRIFDSNNASARYLIGDFERPADRSEVLRSIAANPALGTPALATRPVEVERVDRVDWLPVTIAILVGGLALLAVGHALVSAVRRRGRDFALLKTLGFTRRQVSSTVAWQATTLGVVGVAVGLPLGILLGRALWNLFADSLGIATGAVIPVGELALLTIAALALLNAVALLPGRYAARTQPATALRAQ
jgi:hypothetical protein